MGGIGGMVGLAGGAGGTGFAGPQAASLMQGTNTDQTAAAYTGNQQALNQQSALVTALQGQNGIGNQSQVYNQLQGIAAGTGPNPAQAQLAQSTGANVANQAALMAGQRGSGANVGLMARQAAMQGANTQQQAAGQGATMQAQQSLNALNQAGGMAGQQVANQIGATTANTQQQQGEQSNLLNAMGQYNSANVAMQSNVNNINGQLANTQLQGQQALAGGAMNAIGSMAMMAGGGAVKKRKNFDEGGVTPPPSAAPDTTAPAPAAASKSSGGGGAGALLALLANGGNVQYYDDGGIASIPAIPTASTPTADPSTPQSSFVKGVKAALAPKTDDSSPDYGNAGANALYKGVSSLGKAIAAPGKPTDSSQAATGQGGGAAIPSGTAVDSTPAPAPTTVDTGDQGATMNAARGGKVPAMVSPGEMYLAPKQAQAVAAKKAPALSGEMIKGKATVKGDSLKNDTVPKTLESGGVVIPRSVMGSKDPAKAAAAFVTAHLAKSGHMPKRVK
jgi:hypothetical protein